jgi:hypothetical protein
MENNRLHNRSEKFLQISADRVINTDEIRDIHIDARINVYRMKKEPYIQITWRAPQWSLDSSDGGGSYGSTDDHRETVFDPEEIEALAMYFWFVVPDEVELTEAHLEELDGSDENYWTLRGKLIKAGKMVDPDRDLHCRMSYCEHLKAHHDPVTNACLVTKCTCLKFRFRTGEGSY